MSRAYGVPVSAPTLWEEGRLSASRVVRLAVLAGVMTLVLDVLVNGRLTALFDVGFVLVSLASVLAVRPRDFTSIALLPPLALLGFVGVLALVDTAYVAEAVDGWAQAVVSGLTHRATGLAVAYALVLAVIVIRTRVRVSRAEQQRAAQSQREVSPAPTRTISG
ncbi:hypothetical protein GCM10028771_25510 [Nocardioides marmoraquaticus]